jgi:nucleoid-associated protein YgaU
MRARGIAALCVAAACCLFASVITSVITCVITGCLAETLAEGKTRQADEAGALRARAEELAEEASRRFAEVLKGQEVAQDPPRATSTDDAGTALSRWIVESARAYQSIVARLSQSAAKRPEPRFTAPVQRAPASGGDTNGAESAVPWPIRSRELFQGTVRRLAEGTAGRRADHAEAANPLAGAAAGADKSSPRVLPSGLPGVLPGVLPGGLRRGGEARATTMFPAQGSPHAEEPPLAERTREAAPEAGMKEAARRGRAGPGTAEPQKEEPARAGVEEPTPAENGAQQSGAQHAAENTLTGRQSLTSGDANSAAEAQTRTTAAAATAADVPGGGTEPPAVDAVARGKSLLSALKALGRRSMQHHAPRREPSVRFAPRPSRGSVAALPFGGVKHADRGRAAKATRRPLKGVWRGRASAAAGCAAAGASIPLPGWYVVAKGDTLWGIARQHYGAGRRYKRIAAANRRRLRNADPIPPCKRLYLPRGSRRA